MCEVTAGSMSSQLQANITYTAFTTGQGSRLRIFAASPHMATQLTLVSGIGRRCGRCRASAGKEAQQHRPERSVALSGASNGRATRGGVWS